MAVVTLACRRTSRGLRAGTEGISNRSHDCATARVTGIVFRAADDHHLLFYSTLAKRFVAYGIVYGHCTLGAGGHAHVAQVSY